MNKYKVRVQLMHTFTGHEVYEAEVEAENDEDAKSMAQEEALSDCDCSTYDTELEASEAYDIEILSCEDAEKPRCTKTPDMFGGAEK